MQPTQPLPPIPPMPPVPPMPPMAPMPPPKKGNQILLIVLGSIGLSVLCLCVAVGAGFYFIQQQVSNVFTSFLAPWPADAKALAFSPDGRTLAISYGPGAIFEQPDVTDYSVRLWDLQQLKTAPPVLRGHTANAQSIAVSPDGQYVAAGTEAGQVLLWSVAQPEAAPTVVSTGEGSRVAVLFDPAGRLLTAGGAQLRLWDIRQPGAKPVKLAEQQFEQVAVSGDGQMVAGLRDDEVSIWNLAAPTTPTVLPGTYAGYYKALAWRGAELLVAHGQRDDSSGSVEVVNARDPQATPVVLALPVPIRQRTPQPVSVDALAFSPDGQTLAASCSDGKIRLWSVQDLGAPPRALTEAGGSPMAFSPDGQTLVVRSLREVHLLDLRTDQARRTILPAPTFPPATPTRIR